MHACASRPTWTPSCTPWPARPTTSAAGGGPAETWTIKAELAAYGAEPSWFGLGDKDIATHLVRTRMLAAGNPLSTVVAALCETLDDRHHPAARLGRPAGDARRRRRPEPGHPLPGVVGPPPAPPCPRALRVRRRGFGEAGGPACWEALAAADVVLVAPSNPVVSIARCSPSAACATPLVAGAAPIVGVSPIIGGSPVRGMADKCLAALDVPCTAEGVGTLYGARSSGGLLDAWLVDASDASVEVPGVAG